MSDEWAPDEIRAQLRNDELERLRSDDPNAALLREISMLRTDLDRLGGDDFATRYELESRIDALRTQLHDATAGELADAADAWNERAGRKDDHAVVTELTQTQAHGGGH
ncbi:MAG: hypothetical protein AAGC53_18070 [Actinomycetota bacterium]